MLVTLGVGIVMFFVGYALAAYIIARDADLVRLKSDEIVVKKPPEGTVLVSVPPHTMRKLITHPEGFEPHEARSFRQQ